MSVLHDAPVALAGARREMPVSERAMCRLRGSPYLALRHIACEERDGTLVLHGCVSSYYLKQLAQSVVQEDAVGRLLNEIDVVNAAPPNPSYPYGRVSRDLIFSQHGGEPCSF